MRLKLKKQEMISLATVLKDYNFEFLTHYESRVTTKIIKAFLLKRAAQLLAMKDVLSFQITEAECLALDYALKQANSNDAYELAVICSLRTKINQLCLSI
jgi:hypothetical protein